MGPTDWVKIGNTVTFFADIHSDEEAKARFGEIATDVTANDQSFIYRGSNGRQVELYPGSFENWDYTDGTKANSVIKQDSGPLEGKGVGLETIDQINTKTGAVNSYFGAAIATAKKSVGVSTSKAFEASEDFTRGFKNFAKTVRGIGVVSTGLDAGIAWNDVIEHPTPGGYLKAGFKTVLFGMEVFEATNPYIGLGIAILDNTGVTDEAYKWFNKQFPNGNKPPDNHPFNNPHPNCIGCDGPAHPGGWGTLSL